jgi:hypothetical protein
VSPASIVNVLVVFMTVSVVAGSAIISIRGSTVIPTVSDFLGSFGALPVPFKAVWYSSVAL